MAVTVVVVPPAATGTNPTRTTTPTPVITTIPDAPVLPGVTFNGTPEQFIQFMRDMGQLQPAPIVEAPPAPLTNGQQFMALVEASYWSVIGLLRGVYNMAILVILLLLAAMAMGVIPGITLPSSFSFSSPPAISAPAPRSTGPSLSDRLSGIEDQLGGIQTKVGEIEGEVTDLKAQPAPQVVEQAPPMPAPEPAVKRPFWKKKAP